MKLTKTDKSIVIEITDSERFEFDQKDRDKSTHIWIKIVKDEKVD